MNLPIIISIGLLVSLFMNWKNYEDFRMRHVDNIIKTNRLANLIASVGSKRRQWPNNTGDITTDVANIVDGSDPNALVSQFEELSAGTKFGAQPSRDHTYSFVLKYESLGKISKEFIYGDEIYI